MLFRTQKAFDRLEDRLARLETSSDALERDIKKLNLEFSDLYDRVSRQMSRMAKRYAVDQKENGVDLPAIPGVETAEEIDPISASILRRRGMGRIQK